MSILELALVAFLTTRGTVSNPPFRPTPPAPVFHYGAELAKAIKTDIESIAGPGSVDVSIDNETLFSVRVAVPNFSPEVCTPIYDRELKLYRFFPELNFDFYLSLKPAQEQSQR